MYIYIYKYIYGDKYFYLEVFCQSKHIMTVFLASILFNTKQKFCKMNKNFQTKPYTIYGLHCIWILCACMSADFVQRGYSTLTRSRTLSGQSLFQLLLPAWLKLRALSRRNLREHLNGISRSCKCLNVIAVLTYMHTKTFFRNLINPNQIGF